MPQLTERLAAALADRYRILRLLGEGGMATVYLADDVKHDRHVALKVLKPELAAVLGAERFVQEIRTTASLQHPNILPLFDSGEADTFLYYVMPYIEGETLRSKLDREHQLGIDEAVRIATDVADALDYAHRHGVIHRDIKPENILLHDGRPVVADFGIALAVSAAAGGRMTETGLSLGTPHYMSPEQATAEKEITARSDVYSIASVLYEMLAGVPPHEGGSAQQVIMRIIADTPRPVTELRKSVPPHVAAVLAKALEKLPADRFATAAEFAAGLGDARLAVPVPAASPSSPIMRRGALAGWGMAAAVLVVAAAGWWIALRPDDDEMVLRYEIPVPVNSTLPVGRGNTIAISPDGRFVVFAAQAPEGDPRIYLRAADELQPREVPGTSRALYPFFSPDGEWVGFWSGGQFLRAPVSGGAAVVVGNAPSRVATWTSSGWIVSTEATGALAKVPATGGTMTAFTTLDADAGETGQVNPVALPDGATVLYTSVGMGGASAARIGVASLEDGSTTILDLLGVAPLGVLDDHLVYVDAGGTIMAVPYDHGRRALTGPALALMDQAAVDAATTGAYAQMSPDGSLAYVSGTNRRQLVIVSPSGTVRQVGDVAPLSWPRVASDGRRLAVSLGSESQRHVWLYDLQSGAFSRFTTQGAINDRPEWAPDGQSVVFRSSRESPNAIWIRALDGSQARKLVGSAGVQVDEGVLSPDGRYVVIQRDSTGNGEVWYRALEGDTTLIQVTEPGTTGDYGARFSPDGAWIVYTSGAGGTAQVFVRRFPDLTRSIQVSIDGGTTPVWSPDGSRIYYVNGNQLWTATIGSTDPFTITSRSVVLDRGYTFNNVHADYDVMADGSIVAFRSPSQDQQLVVVRNLGAELRDRLRTTPR